MYKNYTDLLVWQKAHELAKDIYAINFKFKYDERYALHSQIRRAVISVPANIAEGVARQHNKEFIQFLFIAKGSLSETTYYLQFCNEQGYMSKDDYEKLYDKCDHIDRMLGSLISKVKSNF